MIGDYEGQCTTSGEGCELQEEESDVCGGRHNRYLFPRMVLTVHRGDGLHLWSTVPSSDRTFFTSYSPIQQEGEDEV